MKIHTPYKLALALALTHGLAASLLAQTTPTPPTVDATAPEEVIHLSVFTVNTDKDVGYTAIDSLAGGRNNTPIRITPTAVSSLTSQFIDDLGLTDVRSALRWTPNIVPVSFTAGREGGGNLFNAWGYNIRGAGVGPQGGNPPTVNYFPFWGVKDLFSVDRVEVDRGPNSILFGVGNLGGSVSTYTKIPRFDKDSSIINIVVNQYGGERATADTNRILSLHKDNDFAMRVNLLQDHDQGWRKADLSKRYGGAIATHFKISDNASVRLDVEALHETVPQFAQALTDHFSTWDGVTNSPTWGAAPVGGNSVTNNMQGFASGFLQLYDPGSRTLMDWGHGYKGAGLSDAPLFRNTFLRPSSYTLVGTSQLVPALPSKKFTLGPKDGDRDWRYYTITAYFDCKISGNAEIELSAYRFDDKELGNNFEALHDVSVDINKQLPNGATNPNYGQKYADMFLDRQLQAHSANEVRAQFNYHFDTQVLGVPVKEWMSVSAGGELHLLTTRQYIAQTTNNYNIDNWTQYMVWGRWYLNNPNVSLNLPRSINGNQIAYLPLSFNWFDHDISEQIKYAGIVSQTRLWNDRLNFTLGARHDTYYSKYLDVRGATNVPKFEDDKGWTYSAGIVGYITKTLAATYNFSQNFAPIGGGVAPSLTGASFGAARGKSNSVGLRLSTEDAKYYISATYYKDSAQGRISNDSVGFQGIWDNYLKAGGTARNIGPAGTINGPAGGEKASMSFADTQNVASKGFEFEATANPTKNLRLQVTYALPKSVVSNNLGGSRTYYASHLSDWNAVTTTGTQPFAGQLAADLVTAKTKLNETAVEGSNQGVVKSTLSAFAVYSFTEGPLNGFSFGGGPTRLGEQNIRTGGTLKSPGYITWSTLAAYQTRIAHHAVKIQLNVDNVFDSDRLIFTDFNTVGTATQGSNYYLLTPRKFTLSATFKF